ncbi:MAG: type II toxin-antitoxin system VapC family toxin [Verrucomicrobiales bacterium]|nr:type II toxin-antitoxin system VapC family toxin [Verrucomicrobiales bacterium]
MILLDTCALLYLGNDVSALSQTAADAIRSPGTMVAVSSISAFEVGQKAARGQLRLPLPVDQWFVRMLRQHRLRELPISGVIAARATLLPFIHRDPFDRILVATAMEHQLTLLTPDQTIRQYPGLKTLW